MSNYLERRGEPPPDIEQRMTRRQAVEVRGGSGQRKIGGRAATFGHPSEPLPGPYGALFIEQFAPSFFNKSRGDGWPGVTARFMHRDDMILGATRSGTLQLAVDAVGLDYEVSLPESRSDIYELVSRGDIGESSFSFVIVSADGDTWEYDNGMPLRTLLSGKLIDVAPVTQGQYSGNTSVGLRSLARFMDAPEQDVTDAALAGELRRFFTRTDRQRTFPPKPVYDSESRRIRRTAQLRQLEVLAMRWPGEKPLTPHQQAVERMRDKTIHQKVVETYGMQDEWRYGQ